ncbi:MAG: hypothetical protein MUP15_08850 [Dehalococcoidia bacterium]|nr:hypothetical protein [Dehalococcoidia bacterium]
MRFSGGQYVMPRKLFLAPLLLAVAILVALPSAPGAASVAGITERVSVDSAGNQADNDSYELSISADGRFVAFHSSASNLTPGTCGVNDIFVHDRQTGVTECASVDSSGSQALGYSHYPVISGDGRFVAFTSSASNLVPNDTNGVWDVSSTIAR